MGENLIIYITLIRPELSRFNQINPSFSPNLVFSTRIFLKSKYALHIPFFNCLICGKKSSKSAATYNFHLPLCDFLHLWEKSAATYTLFILSAIAYICGEKSSKSAATYTFHLPLFWLLTIVGKKILKVCSNIYLPPTPFVIAYICGEKSSKSAATYTLHLQS